MPGGHSRCQGELKEADIEQKQTYIARYSKHLLNMFLWRKKGERLHTSVSFNVFFIARSRIGRTKVNVHQDQRLTSSSGHDSVTDGICTLGQKLLGWIRMIFTHHLVAQH